jgi:GLPGLI family protein
MKKNNLIIAILLLLNLSYAQNNFQKIDVIYELNYKISKQDSTDIRTEDFLLSVDNGVSIFNSINFRIGDSITKNSKNLADIYKIPKTKFTNTIEKNRNNSLMTYYQKVGTDRFKYIDTLPTFEWKLINDEKKIGEYICKKAITNFAGRNYVAWYSLDFPVFDGPFKFYGLPGLIFQIYDTSNDYNFNLKNIKTPINQSVFDKNSYKKLTKDDFFRWVNRYKNNPELLLKNSPIQLSEEDMKRVKIKYLEKSTYENNPIELTK